MTKVRVYIRSNQPYSGPIRYVLALMAQHQDFSLDFVETSVADWIFDHESDKSEPITLSFYAAVDRGDFDDLDIEKGHVRYENGRVDRLATIFYMVNCLQEVSPSADTLDHYGRFKYAHSYQSKNDSLGENEVQQLMNAFLSEKGIKPVTRSSEIFISHDVDFLYSSRKEDVKWAAKNWRIGDLLKIIFNEFIGNPHARNIDRVIQLNSAYDIRSTFFWLINEGVGSDNIPNADYSFHRERDLAELVEKNGGWNGLHKSASPNSINEEIDQSNHPWIYNRHHFLRFQTHDLWQSVANSRIKLDCSLGFSEEIGFRNSYGKPFTPYDLKHDRPFGFVEMPLHVMDATLLYYMNTDTAQVAPTVIDFIEKHKENCVLSMLWHNNYLTDYSYQGYLDAYKSILSYINDIGVKPLGPNDVIDQYLL